MARLSKREIARHNEAEQLLKLDRLNDDQRQFVLDNWNEGARHMNAADAAFFTPSGLALDTALMAGCGGAVRVLDLCAGIGTLGLAAWWRSDRRARVTCVEINPDYVAVGKKLFPEARWICASVDDLPDGLGSFDVALANPPFGKRCKIVGPRYRGEDDLAVVDIASHYAERGGFILPTGSLPFSYSANGGMYQTRENERYERFNRTTGIGFDWASIDADFYGDDWRGVRPNVEVVTAEFESIADSSEIAPLPLVAASAAPMQLALL